MASRTLDDLARAAGISRTAASYALNYQPGVSDETRQHVLKVAARIGYQRRPARRRPHAIVSGTLGAALSPTRHLGETPNYYVAELLVGVEREARRQHFRVDVEMWTPDHGHAVGDEVDGMLFLGGSFDPDMLRCVRTPSIIVGTSFPQLAVDSVLADNRQGTYLATNHLLDQGCRNIALLNGPSHATTTNSKLIGFRDALQQRRLPCNSSDIRQSEFSVEAGAEGARRLLSGSRHPDGIVAGDDVIAVGALHAATAERGLSVPDDLSIIGFGNSPTSELLRPSLSSIDVYLQQMGQIAVRRLLDRIDSTANEPFVRSLVNPQLVTRGSTEVQH